MGDQPPIWALGVDSRKTRDELEEILSVMAADGCQVPPGGFRTKQLILDFVRDQRQAYWDARQALAQEWRENPTRLLGSRGGFDGMTASACNEFLRSLPPVPLYGED